MLYTRAGGLRINKAVYSEIHYGKYLSSPHTVLLVDNLPRQVDAEAKSSQERHYE